MKKVVVLIVAVMLFSVIVPYVDVFADISVSFPQGSGSISGIDTSVKTIWGTVTLIVQILAMAAVVFAGLRYMFASADQKADIKKGLGMLAIGAILVFATTTVINFIVNASKEIL